MKPIMINQAVNVNEINALKLTLGLYDDKQKQKSEQIIKSGINFIMQYFSTSYNVSYDAIIIYKKKFGQYPVVYTYTDIEEQIKKELFFIERLLKLKKIRNAK